MVVDWPKIHKLSPRKEIVRGFYQQTALTGIPKTPASASPAVDLNGLVIYLLRRPARFDE